MIYGDICCRLVSSQSAASQVLSERFNQQHRLPLPRKPQPVCLRAALDSTPGEPS